MRAVEIVAIPLVYYCAFELRYGPHVSGGHLAVFAASVPYHVVIRTWALYHWGVHRASWRHVSIADLAGLLRAIAASAVLLLVLANVLPSLRGLSAYIIVLDALLAVGVIAGPRFAVRGLWERDARRRQRGGAGNRALIVGSSEAAEQLLRTWAHGGAGEFRAIGVVDDDPGRGGTRIHGVPVLGTSADLNRITRQLRPDVVVIAVLASSGERMRELLERCRATQLPLRIMPSDREITVGRARLGQLREIRTEDLLGRDAVALDISRVRERITGQCVLITGGAGSIGFELARQITEHRPARLVLLDQAETPLYYAHLDLSARMSAEVVPVVGSVTDRQRVGDLMRRHRPALVLHAAAYKHVPMMESQIGEAVRNNVLGTLCVAEAAAAAGVAHFVLISTDKAVNPSCVMGATKRIAERIVLGLPQLRRASTDFRVVRFGNVLGSNGSVIPLFERQLAEGRAVTVTHTEVTRYFMTIPEAVQLVLQTAALPEAAGRICLLEMGEPVRIVDLAEAVIRNAGLQPYRDVKIEFTGLRPGEKLHEELTSEKEATVPTTVEKILVVQRTEDDPEFVSGAVERLITSVSTEPPHERIWRCLADLVPECVDPLRSIIAEQTPGLLPSASRSRRWSSGLEVSTSALEASTPTAGHSAVFLARSLE